MDRMAILAKTQKRHEGKSEGGVGLFLLREKVNEVGSNLMNYNHNF